MPGFNYRTETSNVLIHLLKDYYWNYLKNVIVHYEYGYETHIDPSVQNLLRLRQSNTAKHIRFAPDFLVFNKTQPELDFLFEYKVTKTPRYTFKENQWNYGQIEADAFENYMNLLSAGINVAVVIYCPYHSRPLLCGIPSNDWIYSNRQRTINSQGSGTDYYNIDLLKIPTFEDFMNDQLKVPLATSKLILNFNFYNVLKNDPILQTTHYYKSIYNKPGFATGFNWLSKYTSNT